MFQKDNYKISFSTSIPLEIHPGFSGLAAMNLQDGRQALHYAAAAGCIRISECLLDAGASKNRSTSNGATPFWLAAQQGHLGVVLRLCSARVDLNKSNAETWFQ